MEGVTSHVSRTLKGYEVFSIGHKMTPAGMFAEGHSVVDGIYIIKEIIQYYEIEIR